jgi:hypothetical protein
LRTTLEVGSLTSRLEEISILDVYDDDTGDSLYLDHAIKFGGVQVGANGQIVMDGFDIGRQTIFTSRPIKRSGRHHD